MEAVRYIVFALVLGAIAFFGMQWLLTPVPLKPDARIPTFQRVDVNSPRHQLEISHASDDDAVRDGLRQAVLTAADDLKSNPCDQALKARYIEAASKYARAWLSIAPCVGTRTCGSSDGVRLDRAQKAFGSPLDHRVREAMKKAHETDIFIAGDFAKDVVVLVAEMAGDAVINPYASPRGKEISREFRTPASCRAASLR
jgi:hypothetical protein